MPGVYSRRHTFIMAMKKLVFAFLLLPSLTFAQGGIGNKPRSDLVMLSAMVRDSLSDVVLQNISDLQRMAQTNQIDSAAAMIAWKDSSKAYLRGVNPASAAERAYVADMLTKMNALFQEYPDPHPMYYAVFKTTDTPSGQKHLYQIKYTGGKRSKMVSWVFYPIGDKLLLGTF